jgi:DNA-binding transcriptional MerR regulator
MFSIGEFARHGRVSVRMLRHYDAIGLIRPACVDPDTGYRFYQASQLDELNRVIALKDLGFTLQQVQAVLEEKVTAAELRGMLRLRRAEIQARIEAETTRLTRVEARLMTIEDEARVPADGVVIKRLAPVRVAELTGLAAGYEPEAITPVIQPLYHDLWQRLCSAGVTAAGPAVAYYEEGGDGAVVVHAAVPVTSWPAEPAKPAEPGDHREPGDHGEPSDHGVSIVDLAEVDSAAAIIHHGSMDDVLPTGQALARWIDANGYRSAGYVREVTLNWSPDPEQWVTELQQPIDTTGE